MNKPEFECLKMDILASVSEIAKRGVQKKSNNIVNHYLSNTYEINSEGDLGLIPVLV